MVFKILLLFVPLYVVYYFYNWYRAFQRNIAQAKASGLPYVVIPFHKFNRLWLTISTLFVGYIDPRAEEARRQGKASPWTFMNLDWSWKYGYEPFHNMGSDAILIVSGGGIICYVASAEAAHQIVYNREGFPKAVKLYKVLNIFGRNIVSTEGMMWKHHRRITATPFTPKNNALVWSEALNQANAMMKSHVPDGQTRSKTIPSIQDDTMRLALNIISRAGFGIGLPWPGQENLPPVKSKVGPDPVRFEPEGHDFSFQEALSHLLDHIFLVIATPKVLLRNLPFEKTKFVHKAFTEWSQYQWDLFERKKKQIQEGTATEELDLMGSLLRGAGLTKEAFDNATLGANIKGRGFEKQLLSDEEIIGNVFIFLLAGHETTAHTLMYALLSLAVDIRTQRQLQAEIASVLGDREVEDWTLEGDCAALLDGFTGAVINETLRLFPPVVLLPKKTDPISPQVIKMNGKSHILPPDIDVCISTVSLHTNPHSWPLHDASDANDLRTFKPQRWLLSSPDTKSTAAKKAPGTVEEVSEGPGGMVTSTSLYRPLKGSYMPFSDGYRSCLGRRFAQVELVAVFAIVFAQYSVELAVDDWAGDGEVERMTEQEKRAVWEKAKDRSGWRMMQGSGSRMTLQLLRGDVGVRFVRKGSERFDF